MKTASHRIEKDSLGELKVPVDVMWGAQTQRAIENFPISGLRMPRQCIRALGLIKRSAALVNADLGLLDKKTAQAIAQAAKEVAEGKWDTHFPIDVFQTGSGTSSNMNANEVIARLASQSLGETVHANDHVNICQSSNDVIPTAIQLSAALALEEQLLPACQQLITAIDQRARELSKVVKTGRTHLMDAMPITIGQQLSGWAKQIEESRDRIKQCQARLHALPQGGTAVGTGINAHPEFASRFVKTLSAETGLEFIVCDNFFARMAGQETALEVSSAVRILAVSLTKIANDLRWMNSGPLAGLGEISMPALQPGSSIMPGKVNPVIPEAVAMVAAQIQGNDLTIMLGAQSGNFELNVMLPVIAYNLVQSIELAADACRVLTSCISNFVVNEKQIREALASNPILVTALNSVIGYEKGAAIAKRAYAEDRPILEVAKEMTDLSEKELARLLDPAVLTTGGLPK